MSIEFDNLKIYYIIYKNNLLFNTKNMIKKTLKTILTLFTSMRKLNKGTRNGRIKKRAL